ncbi:sulfatase-like hydrolase/transferase [Halomicroarcula sp. GCM10025324]|uniref:sulfatase-like hydrolase/transferase n=1 Tax=Haloarcula TaxID=2237 RepID=UPI0023E7683E|nr:sulfatase-like hydrolase/transferase [Halomicroarcula sp. ZS-22-S1]
MASPNIVVLFTDQQQAASVHPESSCRTPTLDTFSESGTRFDRCYSPNPICSPSRASFMTGVLPHVHGMINVTHGVEPYGAQFQSELDTWSERLSDAGYTNGYFGKWHVERSGDLDKFGFDNYGILRSDDFQSIFHEHRSSLGLPPEPDRSPEGVSDPITVEHEGYEDFLLSGRIEESVEGMVDHFVYSQGLEFIREAAESDGPWSTVISTYAPHDPYLPPTEFRELYDIDDIDLPESFDDPLTDRPSLYRRQRAVWSELSREECLEAMVSYWAYCSFLDQQVERVIETLQETGQLEDTIIIYTSDHGDYAGAHGLFLKGAPAFEEAYRVPCLVRTPDGYPDGIVEDDIVQLQDLSSTIVDLATGDEFPPNSRLSPKSTHARGGENIAELEGDPSFTATSLVPFLHNEVPEGHRNEAFAEFHGQDFPWAQRIHWRDDLKYVFNTFDEDELYDLAADPHELVNVADDPEYEDDKRALAERMWEIARETGDYQISELHYGMHRFAPVGPNGRDRT